MMRSVCLASLFLAALICSVRADQPASWQVETKPDRLLISLAGEPACEYVFADKNIARPYFCRVHAPGGVQVTRSQPPRAGEDPVDHADMHPGVWLAFGNLNGADFWRNKARVEHGGFTDQPGSKDGALSFTVENRYFDGKTLIATETCRHALVQREGGYWIVYDSTFVGEKGLVFGDQEEMGLGVRVASSLRVKGGSGEIVDSESRRNEREIWGKAATWCDYRGLIDGKSVGLAVLAHPENFRPSWFHVRDYGLLVANPFGRQALTGGEASRVETAGKEPFRLRFAVLVHASERKTPPDLAAAYREYLEFTP